MSGWLDAALPPEAVVKAYGLGPGSWRLIAPEGLNVSFAFVNGYGERLHVKQIRLSRSPNALAASLRRSQELRTHGVPAPILRTTSDGELIAHDGDNVWVVSEWITGRHLDTVPSATAAAVGRVCARLHRALNPEAPRLRTWLWPDDWQEVSAGWRFLTNAAQSVSLPAELVGHVRWLHEWRQEREPAPQASTELVGSIFGDLWLGQFLFTDDLAVCGLLDWDDAGTESALAEELAGLLFRSFVTRGRVAPARRASRQPCPGLPGRVPVAARHLGDRRSPDDR